MAYNAKVGSFNIDSSVTAGNDQAIEGVGFEPKIVLFWWGGSTASSDTVSAGSFNFGFGAAVSDSSRFSVMVISEDDQADSDQLTSQLNSEVIRCYTDTGTLDGIADFSTMDADGFTLKIDDQFTQDYRVSYLALGGSDLTNIYIASQATPTETGNYNVTGVGFQPDAVLVVSNAGDAAVYIYPRVFSFGMATDSNQGVVGGWTQDNQATTNTSGYGYNGEIWARLYGPPIYRDAFVSFGADGFTVNHLEGTSESEYYYFIALKGGQYSVGDLTTRTDGNDIAETVGFEPVAILFASANRALSTQDVGTDHCRLSIGAATSTSERACAAISDEDNLATTETAYANYDSAVYAHVVDDDTSGLMDIKSIDADGFTCVMDEVDAAECWVTYLAIGAAVPAPKIGRKKFKRGGWPYSHPPNEPFELNTQSPQAAGLVAWWPFLGNQGATTPLRDRVRGYDLTHYNGPTWIASASRGWALLFDDASSQYLSIASTPVSQLPFSITAWAYCDSAAVEDYAIAALDQSGGFGRHYLGITAAKAAAAYTSDGDTSGEAVSSKVIVVNTWNYVCGVWATASSRAAFLNGGFKGTDSTNLSFTPDRTAIGAWVRGGSYYFSGMISDVRIYNRALSDAEVWDMYQNRWELYRPVRRVWAFTQGVDSMSPFMKKILKPLRRFEFIRRLEL